MLRRTTAALTVLLVALLSPALLRGQPGAANAGAAGAPAAVAPLAHRLPADTILYVGWQGTDAMRPAYQGSHLQGMIQATDLPKLLDPFLPQIVELAGKENKDAGDALKLIGALGKPLVRYPSAFAFGGVDWADPKQPKPKVVFLTQAGADAAQLKTQIDDLLKDAPAEVREYVKVAQQDGLLTISSGYGEGPLAADRAGSLASAPAFQSALAHGGKGPATVVFLDAQRLLTLVNASVERGASPPDRQKWAKVRDASGVQDVQYAIWTSGFDGPDWVDHAFAAVPGPRRGLLSVLDAGPVADGVLTAIPRDATLAGAGKFDMARFVDTVRAFAKDVDPQAAASVDEMIKQASGAIGMNLQRDLLASLGDDWAYYSAPSVGGRGLLGTVVVNRLRDPAKANTSLALLEAFGNVQMAQATKDEQVHPKFFTTQHGELTIHYLGIPFITPSWAIKDGNLYVGLFPQVVAAAADHVAGKGKSILDNPDFVALRTRLGGQQASGIEFADLPRTAPDSYTSWLVVSRLPGFADLFGVQSPPMLLPPIGKLLPHLAPAGSVSWVDKDGWHAHQVTPFPGATALASDPLGGLGVSQWAGAMSVLLPSLNKAREQANRVKSASNLRQIALGGIIYANNHKNQFPNSLTELMKEADLTAAVFINPSTETAGPPAGTPEELAKWVEENSDYVWVGKGLSAAKAGADDVLAYEKLEGATDGVNIAFADGHVEWFTLDDAKQRIAGKGGANAPPALPKGPSEIDVKLPEKAPEPTPRPPQP